MVRAAFSGCLIAALASVAVADELVLTDGRVFVGTVSVEADTVEITLPYGTLRFPKIDVERIEIMDTPEQEFRKKLADAALSDPNALYDLAQWAGRKSLTRQADDLYSLILKLNPGHAGAHKACGHIRIGRIWLGFDAALDQARGKLEAGNYSVLLEEILPALKAAAPSRSKALQVVDMRADTQLRSRQFNHAEATFIELAEAARKAEPPATDLATRSAMIAEILRANPDGMYILRDAYPPSASLLGAAQEHIMAGPASLATPLVLEAALRDEAKKEIEAGRKLLDEAQKLAPTDPDSANLKYALADQCFQRADAMIPGIARAHRVDIARRKIAAMRKDADVDARDFDDQMGKLGVKDMAPQAYNTMIQRLIHHLDSTRDDLKRIIELAQAYPKDLVLELKWAELDLTKIDNMRKILVTELDGRK
jgi:HPt (histidine-containing phosphotransfer) domain-containing protein